MARSAPPLTFTTLYESPLERLAEGEDDLTALALDLGFSSHSHFADAFRKEFGKTPSEVRRSASRRTLREMSKNLEV